MLRVLVIAVLVASCGDDRVETKEKREVEQCPEDCNVASKSSDLTPYCKRKLEGCMLIN